MFYYLGENKIQNKVRFLVFHLFHIFSRLFHMFIHNIQGVFTQVFGGFSWVVYNFIHFSSLPTTATTNIKRIVVIGGV